MAFKQSRISVLLCLIALFILPVCVSAGLPMVQFPLKPSPAQGPYQDELFFEKADKIITSLSNQTIPTGTALLDLISNQQILSRMSISPGQYEKAKNVNAFLYYTGKTGSYYSDASSLTHSPFSPISQNDAGLDDATIYYSAVKQTWEKIKEFYPLVTLYTLTPNAKTDSEQAWTDEQGSQSSHDLWSGQNILGEGVSTTGHSGLW